MNYYKKNVYGLSNNIKVSCQLDLFHSFWWSKTWNYCIKLDFHFQMIKLWCEVFWSIAKLYVHMFRRQLCKNSQIRCIFPHFKMISVHYLDSYKCAIFQSAISPKRLHQSVFVIYGCKGKSRISSWRACPTAIAVPLFLAMHKLFWSRDNWEYKLNFNCIFTNHCAIYSIALLTEIIW